ncbi:MAG: DUF2076 family protein [Halothiobacillus sp.]
MNAQEHTLLTQLLSNLQQAASQLPPNTLDMQAAQQIAQAFSADARMAYLLTQRHLLLEQALQNAQTRIQALEHDAARNDPEASSFLGGARHGWSQPMPTATAAQTAGSQTNAYGQPIGNPMGSNMGGAPNYAPTAAMGAAPAANAGSRPGSSLGGGSFLGTAAAAATGVVGGALLFQGIEHLMGGGNQGLMGGNGLGSSAMPTENVTNVTENFYGTDAASTAANTSTTDTSSGWDNSAFNDPSADPINDPMGGSDAGFDSTADNGSLFDQSSGDDSGGLFGGGSGDDDWV